MTITFINLAREWGGGEGWTFRTARGLAARGHRVDLVVRAGSPVVERVTGHSELPVRAIPVSFDYHPLTIATLRRHLRLRGSEVVVVHHNKDVRTAAVAARLLGLPVVHRNGFPIVKDTVRHRLTMALVDRILTNSTRIRDTYQALSWLRDKQMDVVPNGHDLPGDDDLATAGRLRDELALPDGSRLALYSGRLTGVKRVDLLIRAMAALPHDSRWRLVIAGDGGQRIALESLARDLDMLGNGRVRFLGFREDARLLAAAADLVLLPSTDEGMPNALMEAMAGGTAVAATPAGDVSLLLDDGAAGWIIPMDAGPGTWTDLLRRLDDHPDELETRARTGRDRIAEHFSSSAMLDGVEACLRAALVG